MRQFTEYFIFYVILWIMDPQVDSRPALFQRLLGSTVNTSLCVSLRGWSSWSQCTSRCIPSLSSGPCCSTLWAGLDQKDNFLRGLLAFPQVQLLDEGCRAPLCARQMPFFSCSSQWMCRWGSSSSRPSTSPSRRRDRFPWSYCSADHQDSTVAVPRQGVDMPVVEPHRCFGWSRQCSFCGVPQLTLFWTC